MVAVQAQNAAPEQPPTVAEAAAFMKEADRLNEMLEMGRSRPWPEALKDLTGADRMDAGAMLEYFVPLKAWLDEQNKGVKLGW